MKNMFAKISVIAILISFSATVYAAQEVPWDKADKYYNQTVTITGKIVSANNTGKACYLNFHQNTKKTFTAAIADADFLKFPTKPEKYYLNKEVKITGMVKEYQGKPAIILKDPNQIQIVEKPALPLKKEIKAKPSATDTEKADLYKQIETLSSKTKTLEKKITDLEARIQKLEAASKSKPVSAASVAQPSTSAPTEIQAGMSKNDVLRLYGKPQKMSSYTLLGTTYDRWEYNNFRQVEFENEKVETWYGF